MTLIRIPAALAALGLAAGAAAVPAVTPAVAGETAPALQLAQAQTFDDEKLQSFAVVAVDVERMREQFSAEFAGAETDEERNEIAQRANDQMLQVVESAPDITVQEYNDIAMAAQQDAQLAARIEQHLTSVMQ